MKIIFANVVNGHDIVFGVDRALSKWLASSGHETKILSCNGSLSACLRVKYQKNLEPTDLLNGNWKLHPKACDKCFESSGSVENLLKLQAKSTHGSEIHESVHNWSKTEYKGVRVGEHARAGLHRYFAKGLLDYDNVEIQSVYDLFLKACFETVDAFEEVLRDFKPDVVVAHHGIYVPQGVIVEMCQKNDIRVVTWNLGYRKGSILLAEGDTYHKIMPRLDHREIEKFKVSEEEQALGASYLRSRTLGSQDWIRYQHKQNSLARFFSKYKSSKSQLLVLTNVAWDAQVHFQESKFGTQHEWLAALIKLASNLGISSIIRIHPAEILGSQPSREDLAEYCRNEIRKYPGSKIRVIEATQKISTYSLMRNTEAAIVYGSKSALEASHLGIPTIICGDSWVRNKCIAYEPNSWDELLDLLKLVKRHKLPLLHSQIKNSSIFAYLLFYAFSPSPNVFRLMHNIDKRSLKMLNENQNVFSLIHDHEVLRLVKMITTKVAPLTLDASTLKDYKEELNGI
jgi:hypothetical protein